LAELALRTDLVNLPVAHLTAVDVSYLLQEDHSGQFYSSSNHW